ncbi:MAG: hypothetical protein ACI9SG_000603 [Maribacter sp.]|jgi:hypothetical protein
MTFFQPTYLWGLFAVALPFIIHLWNKGDLKTIKVGSIRYLKEQETKQTRQLKLNELLLLFLRMLLLTLLVFLLAEPTINSQNKNVTLTYVIEPSLLKEGQMNVFLEDAPDATLRLLAKGFPELDLENLPDSKTDNWQMAQELQQLNSDSIVVFSKAMLSSMKGIRPTISNKVHWIVMDEIVTTDSLVGASAANEGVLLHAVKGDDTYTDMQNEFIPKDQIIYEFGDSISLVYKGVAHKLPLWPSDTVQVGLYYDIDFLKDKDFFSAAFEALTKYTQQPLLVTEVEDVGEDEFDVIVWLKTSPTPDFEARLIRFLPDSLANDLIAETSQNNRFDLTERLSIENVLNGRLTERLLQIVGFRPQLKEAVTSLDKRTISEEEFIPVGVDMDASNKTQKRSSLNLWFWVLALFVLVAERVTAKLRRQ